MNRLFTGSPQAASWQASGVRVSKQAVLCCVKRCTATSCLDLGGHPAPPVETSCLILRIASQKSFFVRCKYLFSSDSILVAPPRLHLRLSTLEQERNMVFVTEKEEDVA